MSTTGNKNKIYVIAILCFAVVVSIWLFVGGEGENAPKQVANTISVETYPNDNLPTNNDWQKILVDLKQKPVTTVVGGNTTDNFDDTTLTAQLSKDFFSQYLSAKQGGQPLTAEEINQITANLVASTKYTQVGAPKYLASNIHIIPKTDTETVKKYRDAVNGSLKRWSTQVTDNPIVVLSIAMKSDDESELAKLDPLISVVRGLIQDFLTMDVPAEAAEGHVALLNSFSNFLSDLETMRVAFKDPVRSFASLGQYNGHIADFTTALKNLNTYFLQKLGVSS